MDWKHFKGNCYRFVSLLGHQGQLPNDVSDDIAAVELGKFSQLQCAMYLLGACEMNIFELGTNIPTLSGKWALEAKFLLHTSAAYWFSRLLLSSSSSWHVKHGPCRSLTL